MIDPFNIGWTSPSQHIAQEFALFCTFVKNKPAWQTARKLEAMLYDAAMSANHPDAPALQLLSEFNDEAIEELLRKHRLSPYQQNLTTLKFLTSDTILTGDGRLPYHMPRDYFLAVFGWSWKTASFFKLYVDHMWTGIVIDTHVRKYMADNNIPWSNSYLKNEDRLLVHWLLYKSNQHPTLRHFDRFMWKQYATRPPQVPTHA